MKKMTYIDQLSHFYSNLKFESLPDEVVRKAKLSFLDYLFVYVVGYNKGKLSKIAIDYAKKKSSSIKTSTLLLNGLTLSADTYAFASGLIAHSVELDDGHRFGTSHPSVVVLPGALAFAEKEKSSYSQFLRAIIIGYDFMLRLARSINPSHLKRGFHTTSTTGVSGTALAAASILGFDLEKFKHSAVLSLLTSSGCQEMLHSNPSSKAWQVGKASQNGIIAVEFARMGVNGPVSILEGFHGWLKAMTDIFDENGLLGDLGSRWEILNCYTKLYPTCRHCHQALDLAIEAFHNDIVLDKIQEIVVQTYSLGIAEVGQIKKPIDVNEAMFSLPYSISLAFNIGSVTYKDLEENLTNEKILSFAEKVVMISDPEMDKIYPSNRGAKLSVKLKDGFALSYKTILPKGEPETPLHEDEYIEKFQKICSGYLSSAKVLKIYDLLMNYDFNKPISPLLLNEFLLS
jgi:2-methylcitrate dehydratase PrpD